MATYTISFIKEKKQHNMQTRTTEEFKVLHANTVRFRNSPILTMQRELNKAKKQGDL